MEGPLFGEARMSKHEIRDNVRRFKGPNFLNALHRSPGLEHLSFEFEACFGLRISEFEF
jgi:hypothetical protein